MADNNDTNSSTDELAGLKAKNNELMGKLKAATNSVTTLQDRLTVLEEAASDAADTTKTEVEKAEAKAAREITKLKADLADRDTRLSTLLIDNEINAAIAKNGVLPDAVPLIEAYLRTGVKMEKGEAIGPNGVSLADHLNTYFASDQAKNFIAAPANSGAGAHGSSAKASNHGYTRENFAAREFEWMALQKTDPEAAKAIAMEVGRQDLAS